MQKVHRIKQIPSECSFYDSSKEQYEISGLGVNDLKAQFQREANEIAKGLEGLVQIIQGSKYGPSMQSPPRILLVAFPPVFETKNYPGTYTGAETKCRALPALIENLAKRYGCTYLDASSATQFCEKDGCHFDEANHRFFAELVVKKIKSFAFLGQKNKLS